MLEYNALDAAEFRLESLLSLPSNRWAITLGRFPQHCASFDNFTKILEQRWFEHPWRNREQWWRPQDRAQFHAGMSAHDIDIMMSETSARDRKRREVDSSRQVSGADVGCAAPA